MNGKLVALLNWATENEIDLNRAEIDLHATHYDYDLHREISEVKVRFWHNRENHKNIINLKRAVEFQPASAPPVSSLKAYVPLDFGDVAVSYEGAFVCKSLGYDCKPAEWKDDQLTQENAAAADVSPSDLDA